MDTETLFYIALAIIYFALQALGSKKKKEQARLRKQEMGEEPQSLGEALREIRDAMGMEEPQPAPAERPAVVAHTIPEPATPPRRSMGLIEEATREYRPAPSEVLAPQLAALKARLKEKHRPATTNVPAHRSPPPVVPEKIEAAPQPVASDKSHAATDAIRQRLRDPSAVREAYVVSEIFGPPRAYRRW